MSRNRRVTTGTLYRYTNGYAFVVHRGYGTATTYFVQTWGTNLSLLTPSHRLVH